MLSEAQRVSPSLLRFGQQNSSRGDIIIAIGGRAATSAAETGHHGFWALAVDLIPVTPPGRGGSLQAPSPELKSCRGAFT